MEGLIMELAADKKFESLCADNDLDVLTALRLLNELCDKKLPIEELELIIPKLARIARDIGDKLAANNENQLRFPFDI